MYVPWYVHVYHQWYVFEKMLYLGPLLYLYVYVYSMEVHVYSTNGTNGSMPYHGQVVFGIMYIYLYTCPLVE
jgi:hypothetical protein